MQLPEVAASNSRPTKICRGLAPQWQATQDASKVWLWMALVAGVPRHGEPAKLVERWQRHMAPRG